MRFVLVLALSGCSMLIVPEVEKPADGRAPVCEENPRGPIAVDGFLAAAVGITTIAGVSVMGCSDPADSRCGNSPAGAVAIGVAGGAATIALIYSAVTGYRRGLECRAALRDWASGR